MSHADTYQLDLASPRDYIALMKPRVMSLVLFTSFIGIITAPTPIHPILALAAMACIAAGAGASAVLNMVYDADIDAKMTRTANRPIPAKRIAPDEALQFGMWVAVLSVLCLAVLVNYLSAFLLAFTIFFYAVIYTRLLKRNTDMNIVIGGAAGALPPVIGWAAATNGIALAPLLMFAIIFFWTPPHFWALALLTQEDYRRADLPMLPLTAGVAKTRAQIFAYALILVATSYTPALIGFANALYVWGAAVLNLGFVISALWVLRASPDTLTKACRWLFAYSIAYLFLLFALLPFGVA